MTGQTAFEDIKYTRIQDFPVDTVSNQFAREIAALPGVEQVHLLPDCFTKEKYKGLEYKITIPSSSVIITDSNTLYPQFRTRGINCGMTAVALPLKREQIDDELRAGMFSALTFDPLYFFNYRLRLALYGDTYDLGHSDFLNVIQNGIGNLIEKFGYSHDISKHFDFGGQYRAVDLNAVRELLNENWLTKRTGRMCNAFGRYFGGNHFFEFQYVRSDCEELGLEEGQVVALFHTGCQGIEPVIRQDLVQECILKNEYVKVKRGHEMYDAFFTAQSLLMNYGHAYRFTTFAIINDVLKQYGHGQARILLDKCHNFTDIENRDGTEKHVYRHNAERVAQGEYGIVSGRYDCSSYIIRGGINVDEIVSTIDHGLGKIIDALPQNKLEKKTSLYRYKKGIRVLPEKPTHVGHIVQMAAKAYFSLMREKKYCEPVVELVPFANMKYSK